MNKNIDLEVHTQHKLCMKFVPDNLLINILKKNIEQQIL